MTLLTVTESPGRKWGKATGCCMVHRRIWGVISLYRVAKNNGQSIFLGLCSESTVNLFSPCWIETSFPHYNNTNDHQIRLKTLIFSWVISPWTVISGFAINFSLVGGPPKNGTVNFLGLCSDEQLFFSPCWIEHFFLIIMTTGDHQIWQLGN